LRGLLEWQAFFSFPFATLNLSGSRQTDRESMTAQSFTLLITVMTMFVRGRAGRKYRFLRAEH
jgi:hypothetical protein